MLVVKNQDILDLTKSEITNAEKTANVLGYLKSKDKLGMAKKKDIELGLNYDG